MAQHWYVINVHSGSEKRVAEAIREKIDNSNLQEQFSEVLVPTHEVLEVRRGKKAMAEKKFFPGYVLIKMEMNEETWYLVSSTPKVSRFLGPKGRPSPISQTEAERLINQVAEGAGPATLSQESFEVGEQVRVSDGPFASFNGLVEEVDQEKARLKVSVSIFGRSTPVDLDFGQVEKV